MRVVFLQDVPGVALGGEVKEVKNGFARNYLLPKKLATPVTRNALQRVDRLNRQAEEQRLKLMADMRALAEELDGTEVNVEMRAGASGRLYGSVTNAIVAEQLSEIVGREIDRRTVEVLEPIREIGVFDVPIHLHQEADATLKVVVYPAGTDPAEVLAGSQEEASEAAEDQVAAAPPVEETEPVASDDTNEPNEPDETDEPDETKE